MLLMIRYLNNNAELLESFETVNCTATHIPLSSTT